MCACLQIVQFMMPLARNFASGDAHNTLSAAWLSNRAVIQADRTWKLYVVRSNRGSIRPCPNCDVRPTARCHTRCRPACRGRIRPLLLAREVCRTSLAPLNNAAVECMVHTASLIFDDLSYMHEAKLRLALPTVDRQFGQYRAILTSAALLSRAPQLAPETPDLTACVCTNLVGALAGTIDAEFFVRGQFFEVHCSPQWSLRTSTVATNCTPGVL